ncbi:MAG: hypothetical protein KGI70_03045 [Patescibacteria group bacterium]|nr:hypothetical protein [Patescibacteria group bacterium]
MTPKLLARKLLDVAESHPRRRKTLLKNLKEALARRGRSRDLARVVYEAARLAEMRARAQAATQDTPEKIQRRILIDMYETLVRAGSQVGSRVSLSPASGHNGNASESDTRRPV